MKLKVLKEIFYFSKYQNFSGGNFSLKLSILFCFTSMLQADKPSIVCIMKQQVISHFYLISHDEIFIVHIIQNKSFFISYLSFCL